MDPLTTSSNSSGSQTPPTLPAYVFQADFECESSLILIAAGHPSLLGDFITKFLQVRVQEETLDIISLDKENLRFEFRVWDFCTRRLATCAMCLWDKSSRYGSGAVEANNGVLSGDRVLAAEVFWEMMEELRVYLYQTGKGKVLVSEKTLTRQLQDKSGQIRAAPAQKGEDLIRVAEQNPSCQVLEIIVLCSSVPGATLLDDGMLQKTIVQLLCQDPAREIAEVTELLAEQLLGRLRKGTCILTSAAQREAATWLREQRSSSFHSENSFYCCVPFLSQRSRRRMQLLQCFATSPFFG